MRSCPRVLLLAAALPTTAASAGTVTLLSQERSVSATVPGADVFSAERGAFDDFVRSDAATASDFGSFEAVADVVVTAADFPEGAFVSVGSFPGGARATQASFLTQQGSEVSIMASGGASVNLRSGLAGSESSLTFLIKFSVDTATAFRLTGTAAASGFTPGEFVFTGPEDAVLPSLASFNESRQPSFEGSRFVFDGTGRDPLTGELFDNSGVLAAGTYRFGLMGGAFDGGIDPGDFGLDGFGIVLADSTLVVPDAPVPIPAPAALPAGLALLAGGLMRRRRGA